MGNFLEKELKGWTVAGVLFPRSSSAWPAIVFQNKMSVKHLFLENYSSPDSFKIFDESSSLVASSASVKTVVRDFLLGKTFDECALSDDNCLTMNFAGVGGSSFSLIAKGDEMEDKPLNFALTDVRNELIDPLPPEPETIPGPT